MGLAPIIVQKVFETIRSISRKGVTMLLVEQNAKLALEASHRGYVINSSEITSSDDAKSSLANPQVRHGGMK